VRIRAINKDEEDIPVWSYVASDIEKALAEDIGSGDITASLISKNSTSTATIITRTNCVLCGTRWVNEVFKQLDAAIQIKWNYADGDSVNAKSTLCTLSGSSRSLLSGERVSLNFLQTLSSVATKTRFYSDLIKHTQAAILDTRKTIPGLRRALKYAVKTGGGTNHRIGLFDGILIKENHISATGGIQQALDAAKKMELNVPIQIEVENLGQLDEALSAGATLILLDNFDLNTMRKAVLLNDGRAQLEASGGITKESIVAIAETGVNRISIGTLTKDIEAIDLSMRFSD